MNVWERSLHSFHSVEMTIKRVDSRPVVAYPLPFEMTEGEEISPCAALSRDDREGSRDDREGSRDDREKRSLDDARDDKREEGIVIN
jgi:hypothetical protein